MAGGGCRLEAALIMSGASGLNADDEIGGEARRPRLMTFSAWPRASRAMRSWNDDERKAAIDRPI
jgi:hypothetical protein